MKTSIKRKVLTCCIGVFICTPKAWGLENKIKIGGLLDAQAIYYHTNGDDSQRKFSGYNKTHGIYSSGHFFINYELISDNGLKYGTKIGIEQTTRNDRATPFSIYIESDYGKLDGGSDKSAGAKMQLTGYSVACGGASGWETFVVHSPKKGSESRIPYVTNLANFLDSKTRTSRKSDYARKISYYSPKFGFKEHEFQLGISYVPDSSNGGHSDIDKAQLSAVANTYPYKFAIKDGISYGIKYDGKFSQDLSLKLAFTGETGKSVAYDKSGKKRSDVKFKNLNVYNVGAQITYDKIGIAGSYMNYNKSFTDASIDQFGSNTNIYVLGGSYKFSEGKYAISLNRFYSNHKSNKIEALSLGLDYKIVKGIKLYAQCTNFHAKGKYIDGASTKYDKSRGNIMILGSKISL